jgi:hypothetical protein
LGAAAASSPAIDDETDENMLPPVPSSPDIDADTANSCSCEYEVRTENFGITVMCDRFSLLLKGSSSSSSDHHHY